jgi:hypothetical protein
VGGPTTNTDGGGNGIGAGIIIGIGMGIGIGGGPTRIIPPATANLVTPITTITAVINTIFLSFFLFIILPPIFI